MGAELPQQKPEYWTDSFTQPTRSENQSWKWTQIHKEGHADQRIAVMQIKTHLWSKVLANVVFSDAPFVKRHAGKKSREKKKKNRLTPGHAGLRPRGPLITVHGRTCSAGLV